jgi:fructokinase
MERPGSAAGRVVSWGEVLWDLYPDGPRLGGAPANLAFHLARLGRAVSLVSRVGDDDDGRRAIAGLAAAGVDVRAIQIDDAGRPTGAVGVAIEDGEARYTLHPGCAWEHIAFEGAAAAVVGEADAICFGTLALRRDRAALEAALEAAPAGALIASDPNLRDGRDDPATVRWLFERARLVKLNEQELAVLGRLLAIDDPVAWLLDRGAALVAITRGSRGAVLHRGGETVDHPGHPATPGGDSVGCGDAFTAVLLHLHLAGAPLAATVDVAARYAAFVASRRGATPVADAALVAAVVAAASPT